MSRSPTPRLLTGLVVTLVTVAVFALYSLHQLDGLRRLQRDKVARLAAESRQLLEVQNRLHAEGVAMNRIASGDSARDSWAAEFSTLRGVPPPAEIRGDVVAFWREMDVAIAAADTGDRAQARHIILTSLERRHHQLSAAVGRFVSQKQAETDRAEAEIAVIYDQVERDVYLFMAIMLGVIAVVGVVTMQDTRRLFAKVAALSDQRQTLAQRLIGVQEETFRSLSRELHDDIGQILTAVGVMLQRAGRKHMNEDCPMRVDLEEIKGIVQESLDKTRNLSQALHPAVLDDYGLERAIERYVPAFEKQTGIAVRLEKRGAADVPESKAIHIYRVLQEALTNVARHAKATNAVVRLEFSGHGLRLQVEDNGIGLNGHTQHGLGFVGMRERAELVHGRFHVSSSAGKGTLVTLQVPLEDDE